MPPFLPARECQGVQAVAPGVPACQAERPAGRWLLIELHRRRLRSAAFQLLCLQVKLDDLPEMGYTNADKPYPRGEVGGRVCFVVGATASRRAV